MALSETMMIREAAKLAKVFLAASLPLIFFGAPGLGKSDLVRQLAGGLPVKELRAGLLDRVDINGIPCVVDGVTVWFPPALLPRVDVDGPEGLLFLDEFTNAPLSVQGALLGLLLDRRVGDYVLPPGWKIIAAGNRQSDRASAQRLSTAAGNRLAQITIVASTEDWLIWAAGADIHPAVVAFLKLRGNDLLHSVPEDGNGAFPSPRTWEFVSRALKAAGNEWLAMAGPIAAALVGHAAATEFVGFLACWSELPRLPEIESNPMAAPVPREMTAKFAISAMLARAATPANMDSLCIYWDRLGGEFSELGVQQAIGRAPGLKETAGYVNRSIRLQQQHI